MSPARVLFWDIECAPALVHAWGLRDLNVGLNQIIEDPYIIGIGYQWDDDRSPSYLSVWDEGGRAAMLGQVWALLDEADVVVGYNQNSFDIPWVQGELMRAGYTPPSPFKSIDLYRVYKKNARFISHKLDYVAGAVLGRKKLQTGGHQLWVDCINGSEVARAKMARYCKRDVALLKPLLKHARPWLGGQLNLGVYDEDNDGVLLCQKCGKPDALRPKGTAYTAQRAYPQYLCDTARGGCGGWTRDSKSSWSVAGVGVTR